MLLACVGGVSGTGHGTESGKRQLQKLYRYLSRVAEEILADRGPRDEVRSIRFNTEMFLKPSESRQFAPDIGVYVSDPRLVRPYRVRRPSGIVGLDARLDLEARRQRLERDPGIDLLDDFKFVIGRLGRHAHHRKRYCLGQILGRREERQT